MELEFTFKPTKKEDEFGKEVEVDIKDDGTIYFSSDGAENFIYFHPSMTKKLIKILNKRVV